MKKLLDVGCGPGTLTNLTFYNSKTNKYKIYGVDIDKKNIQQIKKTFTSGIFLTVNAEKIPYPDNYFDEIVIKHVLEHVKDPFNILKEAKRLLKYKGIIIVAVPAERLERLMAKIIPNYIGSSDSHHQRVFDKGRLIKTLEKAGFVCYRISQKKWLLFFITLFLAVISKIFRLTQMEMQSGVFLTKKHSYLKNKKSRQIGLLFYKAIEFIDNLSILNRLFPWETEIYAKKK